MFWCTPTSVHQIRAVSGSSESNGPVPRLRSISQSLPSWRRSTVAIVWRGPSPVFHRPMWCEHATTPGWMPSVTHALTTKCPIRVSTLTRSPVLTPTRAASPVWSHSGLVCAISFSHFAFALRVWICTGNRKVEIRHI